MTFETQRIRKSVVIAAVLLSFFILGGNELSHADDPDLCPPARTVGKPVFAAVTVPRRIPRPTL